MQLGTGFGMITLIEWLGSGTRLGNFHHYGDFLFLDKDDNFINSSPQKEMVDALLACGYFDTEEKERKDGMKFTEYKLSDKGKRLYSVQASRTPQLNEHFWIVRYEKDGKRQVLIDRSASAPSLAVLTGETRTEDDKFIITRHSLNDVRPRNLLEDD